GRLLLRSVLASDGAPSDRLVLSGGFASGGTSIEATNVGGAGALTSADGIMLVEAVNGASTALQAFSLAGGSISAGAYEYFLYRGGVSAGSEESWFLRSTLVPGSAAPAAAEESGAPDLPPAPPRGAAAVPLYRVEAPLYSAVPPLARSVALASLDTFHERRGEQALMDADGLAGAGWARLTGTRTQQTWSGDAEPGFDGEAGGVQAGLDLYGFESAGGRDVAGVFVGFSRLDGEIDGFALGREDL